MGLVARRSFPRPRPGLCPARGTLDGRFIGSLSGSCHGFTIWGKALCHFLPPPPPSLQPHAPFAAFPPPPLLSFQVTQSLHCTQGVVITGAAEIGQDKGTLPAQDVFPLSSLSFFFSTNLFPLLSCFPFASHVIQFLFFFSHICCTLFTHVSSILAHFPPHICQDLCPFFFNGKTSHS